jgi:hypothetical protein
VIRPSSSFIISLAVPSSARPNIVRVPRVRSTEPRIDPSRRSKVFASHVTASQQAAIISQRRQQLPRRLRRMGGVLGALLHRRSGGRTPAQGQQGRRHTRQPSAYDAAAPPAGGHRRAMLSKKYSYIPDTFTSLDQVPAADPSPCSLAPACRALHGTACKLQTDKSAC